MKIGFVTASLAGGGIARALSVMTAYWCARGDEVVGFTWDGLAAPQAYAFPDAVVITRSGLESHSRGLLDALSGNARRGLTLRRWLGAERPDAVVAMGDQTGVLTLLAAAGVGRPVVVAERIDPRYHPIGGPWTVLRNLTYPRASAVVVQTKAALAGLGPCSRRRAEVIPNPVQEPPAAARTARRQPGQERLVAMGRLHPQKGFDVLLAAFARVSHRFPTWSMTIWGEGPERDRLITARDTLGLRERVALPGSTRHPFERLAEADLFVLSSRYEGFPNVLCEAMSVGCAIVATACPSGPEDIVRDGIDGLLVPPGDAVALAAAMARLMAAPGERQRLGQHAREVTGRFSTPAVMARWDALIDRVSGFAV